MISYNNVYSNCLFFSKSLKMSVASKKESTVGEVTNLMSVDVQRFMDLVPYLNMIP